MHEPKEEVVLDAKGLIKNFGDGAAEVHALAEVSLSVPAGQFLAIMGPSGSGKSTLLNVLGGLETPSSGSIMIEGIDLATLDDGALTLMRRRRIGFIFQAFNLLPILSAQENVAFPLVLDGMSPAQAQAKAVDMLKRLGLAHRANAYVGTMSGGEQQRVAIARALVIDPSFILADEPTGNLDTATSETIVDMLRGLVDEMRKTLIVVTHSPTLAEMADRVVILRDGRIVSDFVPTGMTAVDIEPLIKGL